MPNIPISSPSFVAQLGLVEDSLTNATVLTDGQYASPRISRRGELITKVLYQTLHTLSNEGSLYVAQTATPAVGITSFSPTIGTIYADTQAIFGFNNLDAVGGRMLIPLSLQILIVAVGGGSTDVHIAGRLDSGAGISGGTQLTGKACNPTYTNDGVATIFAGVITVAAATGNVRRIGRAEMRKAATNAYQIGDTVTILWGAVEEIQPQVITSTSASNIVVHMPTTLVPPGWCYCINEWATARTSPLVAELVFQYAVR